MAPTGSPILRGLRRLTGALPLLLVAAVAAIFLVPALFGYQRYVILTGSMTGTYDRGSIVFDRIVPTASLRPGDVITFQPPGHDDLVTHRIKSIKRIDGKRVFTTKGDFNKISDIWSPMTLRQPTQARVSFSAPYVGFGVMALSDRRARMLLIGIPAALIALVTLAGLFKEAAPPGEPEPEPSP